MTRYAVGGALGFGVTTLIAFILSGWFATVTGDSQAVYFLAASPLCGIIGGLGYGRRVGLPVVFGIGFGLVASMFMLQDLRTNALMDVVLTGVVSGFLFWLVGGCATLALPSKLRFDGGKAMAVPGALAGMAFQFLYGPVYWLFDLGRWTWWGASTWEHLILWLTGGIGGGWLFGAELDRLHRGDLTRPDSMQRSRWAIASVVCGIAGSASGAFYFLRYQLPFGLFNGLSPSAVVADWLRSWALLSAFLAGIGMVQTFRKVSNRKGRGWAIGGIFIAVCLFSGGFWIAESSRRTRFDTQYAARLIRENGHSADPAYGYAVYTGNLILAQAALDRDDLESSRKFLLKAATTTGFRYIEQNGPDAVVARSLLQRGDRDTVLDYLRRFHKLWPRGMQVLERWETTISAGRIPNFNNRAIN
jgi:hypothetical protein